MNTCLEPYCWQSKKATVDALPAQVKKIVCFPCKSFESKILFESKLTSESDDYAILKKVLFERLNFDGRRSSVDEGKLYAIVAGSYPAFLGGAVKKHDDVDVFIIANDQDLLIDLLRVLQLYPMLPGQRLDTGGMDSYGDCVAVKNLGKVQLIIKEHYFACLCDFHLNARFFRDFHHCTRWRLHVFDKNYFLVTYMHLERDRDIICRKTAIGPPSRYKWSSCKKPPHKRYPYKHTNNVTNLGPPKLSQQALHVILKK